MRAEQGLRTLELLEDVVVPVHGRLEAVDAGRETLLGRGHRGHDVGGLGPLGGAELLAEAADGGVELAGRDPSVEDRLLIHTVRRRGCVSRAEGRPGLTRGEEGRTSVHLPGVRAGPSSVKGWAARMFGKANRSDVADSEPPWPPRRRNGCGCGPVSHRRRS